MASNISSHESEVETDSVDFNRMSEDKENISNLNRKKQLLAKKGNQNGEQVCLKKKMEEERLKDREGKRLKRSKEKLCPLAVLHRREQDRKRQQKHREKKRGLKTTIVKATGGVRGQKNMLILFERFHRCGVNAFYGMSKFYSVQKLSAFQCVGPLTFL